MSWALGWGHIRDPVVMGAPVCEQSAEVPVVMGDTQSAEGCKIDVESSF